MTEQPAEQHIRVAVGHGNPHRTMNILHGISAMFFAASAGFGVALVATGDIAGWYKPAIACLVITIVVLQHAIRTASKHHDEMELALTLFATIATDNLKAAATLRGDDPAHAWETLADQIKTQLSKDTQ